MVATLPALVLAVHKIALQMKNNKNTTNNKNATTLSRKKPLLSKWGFTIVISVIVFLLKDPLLILLPKFGLDPSWRLGLFWGIGKGLALGTDLVFTYGPLHFLQEGVVNIGSFSLLRHDCLIYFIAYFFIVLVMVYQFAALLYRQPWKTHSLFNKILLIGGLLFFAFMKLHLGETLLVICCILFIRLIFEIDCTKENRKVYLANIILNCVLLSTLCMLKFSFAIAACVLLALACAGLLYKRKAKLIACILPLFILLNVLFWVLCGQPLSALPSYYIHGFEISSGYTEAMMIHNAYFELRYGLFGLLVAVFVGAFSLWLFFVKKNVHHASALFVLLPILFLALKEGFTRADGHALTYFYQLVPVIVYCVLFSVDNVNVSYKRVWPVFIAVITAATLIAIPMIEDTGARSNVLHKEQKHSLMRLLMPNNTEINQAKTAIRAALPPLSDSYLKQAKGKTVDVFPWEVALLYAYDLEWSPRPVIQSYSAYTSLLDSLNAAHFKGNGAPNNVIFGYGTIDGRYPLFDEPATFRTILENYEILSPENYLIFQRRLNDTMYNYTSLIADKCTVGTPIDVPQMPGQHVYCNLDISLSFFGKVMNFLYKPAPLYIAFYIKDVPQPVVYRFVRRMGMNGLFISKYAGNLFDIYQIFRKEYVQNIEKIQIITPHPEYYAPEMNYEFYATPYE
jgi:hypothetical protein